MCFDRGARGEEDYRKGERNEKMDDDFSFDFESKLEEQQKQTAASADPVNVSSAAVPVNQSSSSFKRNFRQVTHRVCLSFCWDACLYSSGY